MASTHTASQPYFEHGYLWASLRAAETPTQISNLHNFNTTQQAKLRCPLQQGVHVHKSVPMNWGAEKIGYERVLLRQPQIVSSRLYYSLLHCLLHCS